MCGAIKRKMTLLTMLGLLSQLNVIRGLILSKAEAFRAFFDGH
jgi:hypothetical protein